MQCSWTWLTRFFFWDELFRQFEMFGTSHANLHGLTSTNILSDSFGWIPKPFMSLYGCRYQHDWMWNWRQFLRQENSIPYSMFFISVQRTQIYMNHETCTNILDRKVMYSDITYSLPCPGPFSALSWIGTWEEYISGTFPPSCPS